MPPARGARGHNACSTTLWDYVIVHELCHLEVRGHGPEFWRLVQRYPKAERAIGYLIAKSGDSELDEG